MRGLWCLALFALSAGGVLADGVATRASFARGFEKNREQSRLVMLLSPT